METESRASGNPGSTSAPGSPLIQPELIISDTDHRQLSRVWGREGPDPVLSGAAVLEDLLQAKQESGPLTDRRLFSSKASLFQKSPFP